MFEVIMRVEVCDLAKATLELMSRYKRLSMEETSSGKVKIIFRCQHNLDPFTLPIRFDSAVVTEVK